MFDNINDSFLTILTPTENYLSNVKETSKLWIKYNQQTDEMETGNIID